MADYHGDNLFIYHTINNTIIIYIPNENTTSIEKY